MAKPRVFETEADLLATVPSQVETALVVGLARSWLGVPFVGYVEQTRPDDVELIPAGGAEGEPLVIATGVPDWGDAETLLPTGGTAGQIVAKDPTGTVAYLTRDATGGVTLPVDVAAAGAHSVGTYLVPGGSMGPNGFLKLVIACTVVTNASRTLQFVCTGFGGGSLSSPQMTSSGNAWTLRYELLVVNQGSESLQTFVHECGGRLSTGNYDATLDAGSNSVDTSVDTNIACTVTPSAAITGSASCRLVLVEYGYIG